MPKKILRRSRNQRNNLRLRALQSDEPECMGEVWLGKIAVNYS
jgi:hypothetical protein